MSTFVSCFAHLTQLRYLAIDDWKEIPPALETVEAALGDPKMPKIEVLKILMFRHDYEGPRPFSELKFLHLTRLEISAYPEPELIDLVTSAEQSPHLKIFSVDTGGLNVLKVCEKIATRRPELQFYSMKRSMWSAASEKSFEDLKQLSLQYPDCDMLDINFPNLDDGMGCLFYVMQRPIDTAVATRIVTRLVQLGASSTHSAVLPFPWEWFRHRLTNGDVTVVGMHLTRPCSVFCFAMYLKNRQLTELFMPAFLQKHCEWTAQHWIDTEPLHPIWLACRQNSPVVLQRLLTLFQWDWMGLLDSPSCSESTNRACFIPTGGNAAYHNRNCPLIIACVAVLSEECRQTFLDFLSSADGFLMKRLREMLRLKVPFSPYTRLPAIKRIPSEATPQATIAAILAEAIEPRQVATAKLFVKVNLDSVEPQSDAPKSAMN